jgi:hypothetical protein
MQFNLKHSGDVLFIFHAELKKNKLERFALFQVQRHAEDPIGEDNFAKPFGNDINR